MTGENLMATPPTLLPDDSATDAEFHAAVGSIEALADLLAAHPRSSLGWALLADAVHDPQSPIPGYAAARVGYHRGLDSLRAAGWRGQGPIPWSHAPNRGVLRSLYALRRSAKAIGETEEVERLDTFLREADPTASDEIEYLVAAAAPPTSAIVILGSD
ncbi:DUF3151 domain-containing protein [Plantibacter sp. M259]|uniref:DUF3151 domain-containing protein n=1 Tax=Plantibacter sp. M259 TaxID=2583822 RepID=UPI0011105DDA|nr:DUF3151 domain-containing protein [Plantibacter sp. M259]